MKNLILSIFAILYWWNISAQCPQGDIIFSTQQEVDDFAASYPGCMEVSGNLIIGTSDVSSDIHDLSPFYQITFIEGDLTIADNDSLISISEWQSLESIEGNITIIDNRHLIDLPNLIGIDSIPEGLTIQNNFNLRSLTGLENITSIERLTIHSYYSSDFEGLKNITSLGRLSLGGVFISDISASITKPY